VGPPSARLVSERFGGGQAFHNEPENRVLAKVTYWIAI